MVKDLQLTRNFEINMYGSSLKLHKMFPTYYEYLLKV